MGHAEHVSPVLCQSLPPQCPVLPRAAGARSRRAARLPGWHRLKPTRTSTWAGSDASTQHLGQRSTSHSSSRAGPSSRKQYHPRHEKSMPGTRVLWKPTAHRCHLLLIPPGGQLCCLAGVRKQGEWEGKQGACMCCGTTAKWFFLDGLQRGKGSTPLTFGPWRCYFPNVPLPFGRHSLIQGHFSF